MLCSSSAFRCFTVFKSPKFEGLLDRNVLRGEKREGVLSCFVADIEDELKLSVADRGCGAVYFVVSSNDASLAAAENAFVSEAERLILLARVDASNAADFALRMLISASMMGDLPGDSGPLNGESIVCTVAV